MRKLNAIQYQQCLDLFIRAIPHLNARDNKPAFAAVKDSAKIAETTARASKRICKDSGAIGVHFQNASEIWHSKKEAAKFVTNGCYKDAGTSIIDELIRRNLICSAEIWGYEELYPKSLLKQWQSAWFTIQTKVFHGMI